jgi:hypothetical protein
LKMYGSNLAYCTAKRALGVLCYNGSQATASAASHPSIHPSIP